MKNYLLFTVLLLCTVSTFAQRDYVWERVYSDTALTVEIAYQLSANGCSSKNKFAYRVTGSLYSKPHYVNWKTLYKDCTGNAVYLLNAVSVGPDGDLNKPIEAVEYSFSGTWLSDKYKIYQPALSVSPFSNLSPQPVPNNWGIGVAYVVVSGRNRACTGESVYLTSKAVGTNTGVSYQWQTSADGKNWIKMDGKTTADCRTPELNVTASFRCICKDDATGMQQTSNELKVVVADAEVNITGTSPVCKGGSAVITASSNEGVTGAGYRWQTSDDNSNWKDATDASTASYKTSALNNTSYFRCVYKPGSGFCRETTSETFTVNMAEPPVVNVTGANAVCKGGSAAMYATATGAEIKGTYQWQASTGDDSYTNISSAVGAVHNSEPLFESTNFKVLFTPAVTGCAAVASNHITVAVTDGPQITAKGSTTVINERAVTLKATGTWSKGPATYQWQESINQNKWTDRTGDTTPVIHPRITSTTFYRCMYIAPEGGCMGVSNTLTVEMPIKQEAISAFSDVKHWDARSYNAKKMFHLGVEAGMGFNFQPLRVAYLQYPDSPTTVNAKALSVHLGFVAHPFIKNFFSLGFNLSGDIGSTPMLFSGFKSNKNNVAVKENYLFSKLNAGTEVAFGFRTLKMLLKYNMSMQTHKFSRSEQKEVSYTNNYSVNEGLRKEIIAVGFRIGSYNCIKRDRKPFCADVMFTVSNDYKFNYGQPWTYQSLSGWQLGFETGLWFQSYMRMSFGMAFYDGGKSYLYPGNKKPPSVYLTLAYSRDWFR